LKALVVCATHYGTTGEIAQRACEVLKRGGINAETHNVKDRPLSPGGYDFVVLGTNIQAGS